MNWSYEASLIMKRAALQRVSCYDPKKRKRVEPDEFIVIDGGKHTLALVGDEPPKYVHAMSDGELRLGRTFEEPLEVKDFEQKVTLYKQIEKQEDGGVELKTSSDLEALNGCPKCGSGTLRATALVEQDLALQFHPDKGLKVGEGEQAELLITMLRCDKCDCTLWDIPAVEYFRSFRNLLKERKVTKCEKD